MRMEDYYSSFSKVMDLWDVTMRMEDYYSSFSKVMDLWDVTMRMEDYYLSFSKVIDFVGCYYEDGGLLFLIFTI